jgi:arylsulfatase A-like enzyme
MLSRLATAICVPLLAAFATAVTAFAQEVLPFPRTPYPGVVGRTLQETPYEPSQAPRRLAADAPNILIIMLDDVGFGLPGTFGGPIRTPTLSRVAGSGVSYNRFHNAAMCSPTRAALLTGRNHHRVGNGQIAELANQLDGYTGVIPRSSATIAEVLREYGYATAAFGKWHNTAPNETTVMGPHDRWPTGHGFDHFYGFLGGETSQYEPRLTENTVAVEPPHRPDYHLTNDIADRAVRWIETQQAIARDRPFFLYWAPGAAHGPFHVQREWADRYRGQFDDGWDAMRQRIFQRQRDLGWIPRDAELTPRPDNLASWDSIPAAERPFQSRLMEVFAGFVEHTDMQAGRLIDALERLGIRDNTLVIYVWGDNGSSAEGQNGTISELLAQNQIPTTVAQHIAVLERDHGGLAALGGPRIDPMYHAGWAWGGSGPFPGTKLVAGTFGGTRTPLAISWPRRIQADRAPRPQFHHVNDIAPTIYEMVGIEPPRVLNGHHQDPIDGVSMAYSFADPNAEGRRRVQYFEIMGSRGIYADGWFASVFGPRVPWSTGRVDLRAWNPDADRWQLFDLRSDYSQARDVAAQHPERLAAMSETFAVEAARNNVFPIGGGLISIVHPQFAPHISGSSWRLYPGMARIPEFSAPNLRSRNSLVTAEVEVPADAQGVVFAVGGIAGGATLYLDRGVPTYEYNMLGMERTRVTAPSPIAPGRRRIEVRTTLAAATPGAPADLVLSVDGQEVARGRTPVTVPLTFTANESFDVGRDLGSPVSLEYFDRAPFAFGGTIHHVDVRYAE